MSRLKSFRLSICAALLLGVGITATAAPLLSTKKNSRVRVKRILFLLCVLVTPITQSALAIPNYIVTDIGLASSGGAGDVGHLTTWLR